MSTGKLTASDTAVLGGGSYEEIARVVAAFLNTSGGRLLLGINAEGGVDGIPLRTNEHEIYWGIKNLITPEPHFSVTFRHVGDKQIALIDVPSGTDRPYIVEDKIFIWKGGDLNTALPREISEMIITRSGEATRWERQPAGGVDVMNLDHRQVSKTIEAHRERGSVHSKFYHDTYDFFADLSLAAGGQLNNSAVVLFARPELCLPQTKVKIASFHSLDRTEFIENRVLEGNLFDLFEQITVFLDRHIAVSSKFEDYTRRDVMAIPPFVVREAVMNALVHRDYSQVNANITIALHPDRLEVWNPGGLPEGLSPDTLPRTHVSRPNNPDIANVAFIRGLVEQWGSGTARIVSECRRMGLKEPDWSYAGGGLLLTIYMITGQADSEKVLNERLRDFLIQTYPGQHVSVEEYQENWGREISQRTARRDLEDLVTLGFLLMRGHRPAVYVRTDKQL